MSSMARKTCGTCRNCQHWDHGEGSSVGKCVIMGTTLGQKNVSTSLAWSQGDVGGKVACAYTEPHFGCIQFEKKPRVYKEESL